MGAKCGCSTAVLHCMCDLKHVQVFCQGYSSLHTLEMQMQLPHCLQHQPVVQVSTLTTDWTPQSTCRQMPASHCEPACPAPHHDWQQCGGATLAARLSSISMSSLHGCNIQSSFLPDFIDHNSASNPHHSSSLISCPWLHGASVHTPQPSHWQQH